MIKQSLMLFIKSQRITIGLCLAMLSNGVLACPEFLDVTMRKLGLKKK